MTKTRLEAFSDGVLAIIITIMVLELKIPHGTGWDVISPLVPVLCSYIFSFIFIAIYWGNHHHLLHTVTHISSRIIWANMHLLFWLTLIPFATAWMGDNNFIAVTVATYAALLLVCGLAYYLLQMAIRTTHKFSASMDHAMKKQSRKGIISSIAYFLAIPLAFINTGISAFIFISVAIMWIIPDKNIEKALGD
jgi:uncharacterized membrane protein